MSIAVRNVKPLMSLPLSFNIDSLVWLLAWRQYACLGIGDPFGCCERIRVREADPEGTQTCRRMEPAAPWR